jgi:hypothetical protein
MASEIGLHAGHIPGNVLLELLDLELLPVFGVRGPFPGRDDVIPGAKVRGEDAGYRGGFVLTFLVRVAGKRGYAKSPGVRSPDIVDHAF